MEEVAILSLIWSLIFFEFCTKYLISPFRYQSTDMKNPMHKFFAFRREACCSSFFCYILTYGLVYFKTRTNLSYPVLLPVVSSDEWLCKPTRSVQRFGQNSDLACAKWWLEHRPSWSHLSHCRVPLGFMVRLGNPNHVRLQAEMKHLNFKTSLVCFYQSANK